MLKDSWALLNPLMRGSKLSNNVEVASGFLGAQQFSVFAGFMRLEHVAFARQPFWLRCTDFSGPQQLGARGIQDRSIKSSSHATGSQHPFLMHRLESAFMTDNSNDVPFRKHPNRISVAAVTSSSFVASDSRGIHHCQTQIVQVPNN